jgi:pyrroloquinoline quinone (PQQ) biosynthesis protein C
MNLISSMKLALDRYCMHTHKGLLAAVDSGMPLVKARRIAREYGPCNEASLRIMAAGLSQVRNQDLAYTLVENIYDESGRGNPVDSHIAMFGRFSVAVGVDPATYSVVRGSRSDILITSFMAVRDEPTEYEALALMHGFEAVFPYICDNIYKALLKNHLVSEEEAFFFKHHGEADIEHSERMLSALSRAADTSEKQIKCLRRSVFGAQVLFNLFDDILSSTASAPVFLDSAHM